MNANIKKRTIIGASILLVAFCLLFLFEIYIPKSEAPGQTIIYNAKRGIGDEDIANDLKEQGIIRSSLFFEFYVVISRQHSKLQAGRYNLSSSMSVAEIVKKFVSGNVIKERIIIFEGWDTKDIALYLESEKLYPKKDFLDLLKKDFNSEFSFLRSKPKDLSLEGYIFPDTYYINSGEKIEDFLMVTLANFDRKLTPDLRKEISSQNKSIFQIITMASIIEKEVRSTEDKKIVSGLLWKRIESGMPLQVDATVNYITDKNDPRVTIKDTKIDSPYNTYKYQGLPLGPISNPGMDSILASIYPTKSEYWYYLSASRTGKTIFSKTLEEHNRAVAKYLNY